MRHDAGQLPQVHDAQETVGDGYGRVGAVSHRKGVQHLAWNIVETRHRLEICALRQRSHEIMQFGHFIICKFDVLCRA